MAINFIFGANGSGKTNKLLSYAVTNKENLIVTTDPAVFYVEKKMAENNLPGKCVGISSLINVLLQELDFTRKKIMSKEAQIILIGKIIKDNSASLLAFGASDVDNGNLNNIFDFLKEMRECGLTNEDISTASETGNIAFANKMHDMKLINEKMNEYMSVNNLDTQEGIVNDIVANISKNRLRYNNILIDTLDDYTVPVKNIIKKFIEIVGDVTIAMTTAYSKTDGYEYFKDIVDIGNELFDYAQSVRLNETTRVNLKAAEATTGISAIKNGFFGVEKIKHASSDDIVLCKSDSMQKEVDFVVSEIAKMLKNGTPISDITIVSSSIDRYSTFLTSALEREHIPTYYYKTSKLENSNLFAFFDCILDIAVNGYNADNFTQLTQFSFINITNEERSCIVRYFIRFGDNIEIAFKNGEKYDNEGYSVVKKVFDEVVSSLGDVKKANTAVGIINALMGYFQNINIRGTIAEQIKEHQRNYDSVISDEIIQQWNSFMNMFKYIYDVYGEETLTWSQFAKIAKKAASDIVVKSTTHYSNYITIMPSSQAKNQRNEIMFVVGCNEGFFPKHRDEGLIGDEERRTIEVVTSKHLNTTDDNIKKDTLSIFSLITIPSKKLYMTWSNVDEEGNKLEVSSEISNIVNSFPECIKTQDEIGSNENSRFIKFLTNLSKYKNTSAYDSSLLVEYQYFASHPRFSGRLSNALNMLNIDKRQINSEQVTNAYVDNNFFAVTRIEKFNACPFKHFMDYAMKPQSVKEFLETAADKGNYYHIAAKRFFDMVVDGRIDIHTIDDRAFNRTMDDILDEIESNHNEDVLNATPRNKYKSYQMRNKIKNSIWQSIEQLRKGEFKVSKNEYVVGKDIATEIKMEDGSIVNLVGTIDRVDTYDKYARIIDYKSGDVSFSEEKLNNGIQLQLPLYAKAISSERELAGMYYYRIHDAVRDVDDDSPISKKYQMSGVTLENRGVCVAMDTTLADASSSSTSIQVAITAKDDFSKRSNIADKAKMDEYMETATTIANDTIARIKNGETKAYPYASKDVNSCEYCRYRSICHFDASVKGATRKPQ